MDLAETITKSPVSVVHSQVAIASLGLFMGGFMKAQDIRKTISVYVICVFLLIFSIGCATNSNLASQDDSLYQISLLNALMLGDYDGIVTVEEFLLHGDMGIGTFDALDGEMIMLDGEVYKAAYTGVQTGYA